MVQGNFSGFGELLGAGGNEQLRHLVGVEIGAGGEVQRRAEHAEHHGHFVLLDQAAGLLDRLRRAVAVVDRNEGDLAAVDAAAVVDHLEEGGFGLADLAVGRGRTAIGDGLTDLDFGVADAGAVFLLRESAILRSQCCGQRRQRRQRDRPPCEIRHDFLPVFSFILFLKESARAVARADFGLSPSCGGP